MNTKNYRRQERAKMQHGTCGEWINPLSNGDHYIVVPIPGEPIINYGLASIIHAIGDTPLTAEEKKFVEDEFEKIMLVSHRFMRYKRKHCLTDSSLRCALFNVALFKRDPKLRASFCAGYDTIDYNSIYSAHSEYSVISGYIPVIGTIEPKGLSVESVANYLHHKLHI